MIASTAASDVLHCPGCGYNLFGIGSSRCPECGLEVDRQVLMQSQLPWSHRRTLGRVRAFFKTVFLATFRPMRIAREMNCLANFADARRFRLICMILVWPAIVALALQAMELIEPFDLIRQSLEYWDGFSWQSWRWVLAWVIFGVTV